MNIDKKMLFNVTALIYDFYTKKIPLPIDIFKQINIWEKNSKIMEIVLDDERPISYKLEEFIGENIIKYLPFESYKDIVTIDWIITPKPSYEFSNEDILYKAMHFKKFDFVQYSLTFFDKLIDSAENSKNLKDKLREYAVSVLKPITSIDYFEYWKNDENNELDTKTYQKIFNTALEQSKYINKVIYQSNNINYNQWYKNYDSIFPFNRNYNKENKLEIFTYHENYLPILKDIYKEFTNDLKNPFFEFKPLETGFFHGNMKFFEYLENQNPEITINYEDLLNSFFLFQADRLNYNLNSYLSDSTRFTESFNITKNILMYISKKDSINISDINKPHIFFYPKNKFEELTPYIQNILKTPIYDGLNYQQLINLKLICDQFSDIYSFKITPIQQLSRNKDNFNISYYLGEKIIENMNISNIEQTLSIDDYLENNILNIFDVDKNNQDIKTALSHFMLNKNTPNKNIHKLKKI